MAPVLTDGTQVSLETKPLTFQQLMVEQIKRDFGDMLGPDIALLDSQEGLDALASKLHAMTEMLSRKKIA